MACAPYGHMQRRLGQGAACECSPSNEGIEYGGSERFQHHKTRRDECFLATCEHGKWGARRGCAATCKVLEKFAGREGARRLPEGRGASRLGVVCVCRSAPRQTRLPRIILGLTPTMSSAPAHEIILVPARDALRQQCYDVRIAVFHREQGFPLDTEIDDLDASATHFLLRLTPSLTPVGTIRCTKHARYYKLSRLAVLADCRRFRLGRALVLALHAHVQQDAQHSGARDGDAVLVRAHSQLPARGFYAKLGYQPEGEEFDEDGAPHQLMVARLPLSD